MSMPPPPQPKAGNPNYFSDRKKGEVNELKNLLRDVTVERDPKKKREIIKKVIAYMTLGIDVSRIFSEMVLCVDTKDIITKKMVYYYLTNYANKNSDLAIMCINTLLNDWLLQLILTVILTLATRNEDPLVRGLALRSLCSLRLDSILEYIHEPLQHSLTDTSAYVRKTGVIGILKVFSLNKDLIKDSDMVDTLYNMIRDRDPQVVSNCLVALNEIMADEGGIAVNQQIIMHLLTRISEFNEWGQCNILHVVSTYNPSSEEEIFNIMNILEPSLRVSNSAVVLGTAKCFLNLTIKMPQVHNQVFERMRQPLLTLMAGGSHELNYCVLHHILLMVGKYPRVFSPDFRQFYIRYNEPSHVKYVKLDILSAIADSHSVADIIMELSEYVNDVDQELSRRAVRAISQIAVGNTFGVDGLEAMHDQIVDTMVEFLELNLDYVRDETLVVMKDLLRKFPHKVHDVLDVLPRIIPKVDDAAAKCAVIWMLGEFGQDLRRAPYVLEKLIDSYGDEPAPAVLLELLSASLKLFFKRPPEMQSMLGRLLSAGINDTANQDVRDRALFYYRLLAQDVSTAAAIVRQFQPEIVEVFAEMVETDLQEKLFKEFNTLAVVYNKPSETFVAPSHLIVRTHDEEEADDDEGYSDEEQPLPPQQPQPPAMAPQQQQPSATMDLLGMMDFSAPAPAQPAPFALVPNPSMDAGTFQQLWGTLRVVAQIQLQMPGIPPQADIERAFGGHGILTMAAGDVGPQYKFFFYAQDVAGKYYLAETVVEKGPMVLHAVVKGQDDMGGQQFGEYFKRVLFG
ncbi:AP-1 complex subunit beta [Achlya hypogyna]|uniref:AP complex subunit beta n=1 Tax=Achlya hypogyna TaxID=1202772 RepID=A0A1V9ZDR0_ACHHY|nr:AP-1 complex subunit beta [Achlya hypogyna]